MDSVFIGKTANATDIKEYFNPSPRKTIRKFGKVGKGYKIESCKFNKQDLEQISNIIYHDKNCPKIPLEISPEGTISQE